MNTSFWLNQAYHTCIPPYSSKYIGHSTILWGVRTNLNESAQSLKAGKLTLETLFIYLFIYLFTFDQPLQLV